MKKKIGILGSTGSIGKNLIKLLLNKKTNSKVIILSCNENYKLLLKQCKLLDVKNAIIFNKKIYEKKKKIFYDNKINLYNDYAPNSLKFDYVMSAISGVYGINPTLNIIQDTKNISIANKESIICAWPLIKKKLTINKTNFVPTDSEHFSIWYSLKKNSHKNINHIFLTASGGPFLHKKISELKNVKVSEAINHPNWKMGKKISVDSATMMNKVFEIIEAKNIFNLNYNQLSILIHPKSYIHSIVKFNDGMIEIMAHEPDMKIPILNTLPDFMPKEIITKNLNIHNLNNLCLSKINLKKFPLVNIINKLSNKNSLFETAIVAINDKLVDLYLNKKINFTDIQKIFLKKISLYQFKKYKKKTRYNLSDIMNLIKKVHLNLNNISV